MLVENKELFTVIYADKDKVLTEYTDDKDIKEYNGSEMIYAPKNFDASVYREITKEQAEEYEKRQREAIEEEMKDKKDISEFDINEID